MGTRRNPNSLDLLSSLSRHRPYFIRLLYLLVAVFLIGQLGEPLIRWIRAAEPVQLIRYPYLQQLSSDAVTIVWTTTESGPSEARYSTDLSFGNVVPATSTFKSVSATAPYNDYYEHVAILPNLTPGTLYNYAIYTQGDELATDNQLHFRTNPGSDDCTFNFAMLGDTGVNGPRAQHVRDQALARGFDFAINVGDLAYDQGNYDDLEIDFFNLYQDILWGRMMWTAIGNHEYNTNSGAPYLDVFHLPQQALRLVDQERYYSFDYGNAHFIVLDTNDPVWNISSGSLDDMADWLEADLIANDSFWTIVMMHHPWYVSDNNTHPTPIHTQLVPLFEAYNVDIVLTGHDHLYQRTFPIKADALSTVADGGVVYVTNGEGGGKAVVGFKFTNPAPNWSASRSNNSASYTHIYVDNGVMSLITIDENGNIIDAAGTDPIVIIDRSNEPDASCQANVSGMVYEDDNGDGAVSVGDTPLAGVQINLSDGQSTTTNANGFYQFTNLTPGNYTIVEIDPSGYLSSGDAQGANDNTIAIDLQAIQSITNQNFFDYQPATITGMVFEDTDDDGSFSLADMPLEGVEIALSNGQSTTTDANGFYQFLNLVLGNYTITEIDPPGYVSILDVEGGNDNFIAVSVTSGDNIVEQNFLDKESSIDSGTTFVYLPVIRK